MVCPSAHLVPAGICISAVQAPAAHCWYDVPPTQLNMPSLAHMPERPPSGVPADDPDPVVGTAPAALDVLDGATAAAELELAAGAGELEGATALGVGTTLVANPEDAGGAAADADELVAGVGAGAALLAAGGAEPSGLPLEPEPEEAPFGTQLSPCTLAKLLFEPGFSTLGPGLGNSGSVEAVVLQELISARLATKSSGNSARLAIASVSLASVLFDFPPVTVIGAQFM